MSHLLRQAAATHGGGSGAGGEWILHLNVLQAYRQDVSSPAAPPAAAKDQNKSYNKGIEIAGIATSLSSLQAQLQSSLRQAGSAERMLNNNSNVMALSREFSSYKQVRIVASLLLSLLLLLLLLYFLIYRLWFRACVFNSNWTRTASWGRCGW